MKLELNVFHVEEIVFDTTAKYSTGVLHVNKDEIRRLVLEDDHFIDVEIAVARPGERTRIINVLDVVEPRHKVSGPGTVFPGLIGPPTSVGSGVDNTLRGATIVTTGEPVPGEPTHWRDGIIDMWGEGARHSPFSNNVNLVVKLLGRTEFSTERPADLEKIDVIMGSKYSQEYNLAARVAGFKIANYLASTTKGLQPDEVETFELGPANLLLPRVVYTCQLNFQRLYGAPVDWVPTFLHPNEMLEGVMFNYFMDVAGIRDPSYVYQNHPVVRDLYRRHSKEINFVGVLAYNHGGSNVMEKERNTSFAVKLLKMLNVDGVVMTWTGGGHLGIDIMMLCQKCERAGIKTTLLNPEMARTRDDPGFVHYVLEADAITSTGIYERELHLERADRVLGGTRLQIPNVDASRPLDLSVRYIYASANPQGLNRLAGVQY